MIPVAARPKNLQLLGIVGLDPTEGMDVYLLYLFVLYVETSATSWSLFQGSRTGCVCLNF
jgi:hypothetical protein